MSLFNKKFSRGILGLIAATIVGLSLSIGAEKDIQYNPEASVNSSKMRLWVAQNQSTDDSSIQIKVGSTYYENSGNWINLSNYSRKFYYIDLPIMITGTIFNIVRANPLDLNVKWNTSIDISYTSGDNGEAFYLWGDCYNVSKGAVGSGTLSVDAGMAAKAIEGYLTCAENIDNGYLSFPKLRSTFVMDGTVFKTNGNIGDNYFNDYQSVSDYSGDVRSRTSVSAWDKYTAMETNYNAYLARPANPIFITDGFKSIGTLSSFIGITILILGSCFIILKKRLAI